MAVSDITFASATHHAKGAWGTRTHSAYGTVTIAGEVIDWNGYRHYDASLACGERTSWEIVLCKPGSLRELTAAKWEAGRAAAMAAFKGKVREMAAALDAETVTESHGVEAGNRFRQREEIKAIASTDAIKVVGTIDLTPTWSEILPTMLLVQSDATHEGRAAIRGEFERMAALADKYVAAQKALKA